MLWPLRPGHRPVLIPRTPEQTGSIFPCLPHASCLPYVPSLRQSPAWRLPPNSGLLAPPLTCCVTLSKSLPLSGLCFSFLEVTHQVAEVAVFPLLPVTPRPAVMSRDKALLPGDSYPASAMFPWTNNCHRVNPHRLHCAGGSATVTSHPQPHRQVSPSDTDGKINAEVV